MMSYIDFKTLKLQQAKNDFERDFFKPIKFVTFGETMEIFVSAKT